MLKKIIIYWLAKCLSRTEKALSGISLPDAGQILFISKSIGTVAATAFAKQHGIPARQLLFTPLADINRYVEDGNGLVFYGSGDPFADPDVIADKSMWPLLMALKEKGLKEDGLLELLYELMGESLRMSSPYSIFLFYGAYDVPVKGTDGQWLEGSEEQYDFLVCAVSPLAAEYEPGRPEFGFLFPAFSERSSDPAAIYVFHENPENRQEEFLKKLVG